MTVLESCNLADAWLMDARAWVRKTSPNFDPELRQTLAACMLDLQNAGVKKFDDQDPLLQQAAKFYVKSHFGYDDQSEKWNAAYEHLKAALSLSGDYTRVSNG